MALSVGLVPLDGSATAECVLPWAVTLAHWRMISTQLRISTTSAANVRTPARSRPVLVTLMEASGDGWFFIMWLQLAHRSV